MTATGYILKEKDMVIGGISEAAVSWWRVSEKKAQGYSYRTNCKSRVLDMW